MIDLGQLQSALIAMRPQPPASTPLQKPGKGDNIAQAPEQLNPDTTPHWYYKAMGAQRGAPNVAQPTLRKSLQP